MFTFSSKHIEAKISQTCALPSFTGYIIWSQRLNIGDWPVELSYQVSGHVSTHSIIYVINLS